MDGAVASIGDHKTRLTTETNIFIMVVDEAMIHCRGVDHQKQQQQRDHGGVTITGNILLS